MTSLFFTNPSSYFLEELQRCLNDPDWLAQLFIKHVRLKGAPRRSGAREWVWAPQKYSLASPVLLSLNSTPVRSAGCICTWCTVRISPSQSMWYQNLGIATLRSVAEVPWGKGDKIIRLSRLGNYPVLVARSSGSS